MKLFALIAFVSLVNPICAAALVWLSPPNDPHVKQLQSGLKEYAISLIHLTADPTKPTVEQMINELEMKVIDRTKPGEPLAYGGYREDGWLAFLLADRSGSPENIFGVGSFSTALEFVRLGIDVIQDPHSRNHYKQIMSAYENLLKCNIAQCLQQAHKLSTANLYKSWNFRPPWLIIQAEIDPQLPHKQVQRFLNHNPLLSLETYLIPDEIEDTRTPRSIHRFIYFLSQALKKFTEKTEDQRNQIDSPFSN